jgi:hypothetical protein
MFGFDFRQGQARSLIPGKRLSYLARDPFRRRMSCDVDPDKISTIQPDNDEGVEQLEADRRDDEHIHRGDVRGMIAQKGAPSLARRSPSPNHVFGDA